MRIRYNLGEAHLGTVGLPGDCRSAQQRPEDKGICVRVRFHEIERTSSRPMARFTYASQTP